MTDNAANAAKSARPGSGSKAFDGALSKGGGHHGGDSSSSVNKEVAKELTSPEGNRRISGKSEGVKTAGSSPVRDARTNSKLAEQIGGDLTFAPLLTEYGRSNLASVAMGEKKSAQIKPGEPCGEKQTHFGAGPEKKEQGGEKQSKPDYFAFSGASKDEAKLDPKKSIAELLAEPSMKGKLRIAENPADPNDAARIADRLKPGETPNIKVVYSDESNNPNKPQPDIIVKKDGTVHVVNDHEKNPDKEICVVVERKKGETDAPPAAQQKAVDELVDYLGTRLSEKYPYPSKTNADGTLTKQVPITDQQNLLSDQVEKKFGNGRAPELPNLPPPPEVPQQVRDTSDSMNRVAGSGGSRSFSRDGVDSSFPRRDVPQPFNESNGVAGVKDALASINKGTHETIRNRADGHRQVGRYGLSDNHFGGWLEDILGVDLGDPPDMNKLRELLKKDPELRKKLSDAMAKQAKGGADGKGTKVPQEFADKFAVGADGNFKNQQFIDNFLNFGDKLKGGGQMGSVDVNQYLPKELQDVIAQDRIQKFAHEMGIADPNKMKPEEAGRVGVAMYLGRVPTQNEMADPSYQKYAKDFSNMYEMSRARQSGLGDINVSDANGKMLALSSGKVGQQLWAQGKYRNVVEGGNLGCAASVTEVLQDAGFSYASSAGVGNLTDQLMARGWKKMPVQYAQPGDVVYGHRGNLHAGGGNGHIGVVGENGTVYHNSSRKTTWSHDNLNSVFTRRFGSNTYVLRPPSA